MTALALILIGNLITTGFALAMYDSKRDKLLSFFITCFLGWILIGFICGKLIREKYEREEKIERRMSASSD